MIAPRVEPCRSLKSVRDVPRQRRGTAFALAAGVGVVGIIMMHYPMIVSGLRRMQINVGDSRLINYFLEHNYRWFRDRKSVV